MDKASCIQLPGREGGGGSQHVSTSFFLLSDSPWEVSTSSYFDRVYWFEGKEQALAMGEI